MNIRNQETYLCKYLNKYRNNWQNWVYEALNKRPLFIMIGQVVNRANQSTLVQTLLNAYSAKVINGLWSKILDYSAIHVKVTTSSKIGKNDI